MIDHIISEAESERAVLVGLISDQQKKEMREWYESLIDMMRREDVAKTGHLQLNRNVIIDLEDLHRRLMAVPLFSK